MTRKERRYAKRSTRWCYRMMDKSLAYLQNLHTIFAPTHPGHAELLELIATMQLQTQQKLEEFYRLTWGTVPGDWYQDS